MFFVFQIYFLQNICLIFRQWIATEAVWDSIIGKCVLFILPPKRAG